MSNSHVHAVFGPILDSILRSNIATAKAIQRAAAENDKDDEIIDPPMTGADHRAMQDEMRHDDDRAGIA